MNIEQVLKLTEQIKHCREEERRLMKQLEHQIKDGRVVDVEPRKLRRKRKPLVGTKAAKIADIITKFGGPIHIKDVATLADFSIKEAGKRCAYLAAKKRVRWLGKGRYAPLSWSPIKVA